MIFILKMYKTFRFVAWIVKMEYFLFFIILKEFGPVIEMRKTWGKVKGRKSCVRILLDFVEERVEVSRLTAAELSRFFNLLVNRLEVLAVRLPLSLSSPRSIGKVCVRVSEAFSIDPNISIRKYKLVLLFKFIRRIKIIFRFSRIFLFIFSTRLLMMIIPNLKTTFLKPHVFFFQFYTY